FEPDILTSGQWRDRVRTLEMQPERLLMLTVLCDGVEFYVHAEPTGRRDYAQRVREAEQWIASNDRGRLFAFASLCEAFNLDVEAAREGIRRQRARFLRGASPRPRLVPQGARACG